MAAKGYDDSPPRNGIIFFYTILTVFTLIGVKFLLDSYFFGMMEGEYFDKVYSRGMEEVAAVRQRLDLVGVGEQVAGYAADRH
jgi:hypothetical protein